jgi:hypothetical protein
MPLAESVINRSETVNGEAPRFWQNAPVQFLSAFLFFNWQL